MGRPRNLANLFKPVQSKQPAGRSATQGQAGFDNPRENIDPHIKTKVIDTIEGVFQKLKLLGKTAGSVLFVDSNKEIAEDNANLFWDDSNKRLGVGTVTPGGQIDITGQPSATPGSFLEFTDKNNTALKFGMRLQENTRNLIFDRRFNSIWTPVMAFERSTGRVGIGTTAPTAQLDIVGGGKISGNFDFQAEMRIDGRTLRLLTADNSNLLLSGGNATNSGANLGLFGGEHATLPNLFRVRQDGDTVLSIIDGGNVGIGEEIPENVLHVKGNTFSQITAEGTSSTRYGGYTIRNDGDPNTHFCALGLGGTAHPSVANDGFITASGDFSIVADNIGIGIRTPSAKLHVDHASVGRAFRVDGQNQTVIMTIDDASSPEFTGGENTATMNATKIGGTAGGTTFRIAGQGGVEFAVDANSVRMSIISGGNVGIGTETPTTKLSVNEKNGNSPIGGFCIKLTNKSGADSVAGDCVIASTTVTDAVNLTGANDTNVIGAFLESGIADGEEAWVGVSGIVEVHMDAGGCALGDRIVTSATPGRGTVNNAPAVAVHFQEIGHAIQAAAANGTARIAMHIL